MNLNKYHVKYGKNGFIHWKKGAKQYPQISLDKIILEGEYETDRELLEAAKEQFPVWGIWQVLKLILTKTIPIQPDGICVQCPHCYQQRKRMLMASREEVDSGNALNMLSDKN